MKRLRLKMEDVEVAAMDHTTRTPIGLHHQLQTVETAWRVRGENLAIGELKSVRPLRRLMDYEGALCGRCGKRKPRKGGKNINHKFVCAGCL